MKTDLSFLPGGKRRELAHVVEVLLEEFQKVVATRKAPRLKGGQVLKIILFGSYARGDWVEDPIGRYFSDYDLLIIVDHEDLADTTELFTTRVFTGTSRSLVEQTWFGAASHAPAVSPACTSTDDG